MAITLRFSQLFAVSLQRDLDITKPCQSPKALEEAKSTIIMAEGMSMSDYLTLEKVGNRNHGVATTALGLGIGLGAAALVGVVAVGWGVNAASKSRSRAAEQVAAAQAIRTNDLMSLIATERSSRETWQGANQPTLSQVIELQNNPSLQSTVQDIVTAMARAEATANNSGINSAVGSEPYVRAMLYSAPKPCDCPGCNG